MILKNRGVLLVLLLILSFGSTLRASDKIQHDTLSEQLSRLNIMRAQEPMGAKNEMLQLLSNFPEKGTNEQLFLTYTMLGSCYVRMINADSARFAIGQARRLLTDDIGVLSQFDFNRTYGSYYRLTKSYDSAAFYFEKTVQLAEEIDQPHYYALAYNGMGNLALDKGQLNISFEYFLKSLHYFEEINDTKSAAIIYNNLALINIELKDYERGLQYFYKAIATNKANNAIYDMAINYGNLGTLYKKADRLLEAIAVYDTATRIAEEHGFVMECARNKLNLGNLQIIIEDFDSAEKNFLASLKLCEDNGIIYGKMLNYNGLAILYLETGVLEKAETYSKKALELAERFDDLQVLRESNDILSSIYEKRSLYAKALSFRKAFEAANDSLISRAHKNLIIELQAKYDSEKKELENISLRAENLVKAQVIKEHKTINIIISSAVVLLALLLFFVFRVSHKLKKANNNLNHLYRKMAIQNTVLEGTISTKDKLFSIIGHDLRSPFNSMLGFLQLMIDQKDDLKAEERDHILNQFYSKSYETYTLVENLLQWAMSQRGQIAFKPEQHNIFEIVEEEIRFLQNRADKKQIQLINALPDNLEALCDRNMISSVFRNIINNAIKFTPIEGFVKLTAEDKSDFIYLKISDNGIGMDAETLNKIQQSTEFYSNKGTENESGTGLGLKIVKDFLTTNNASFSIKSTPGQGTDFVIRFAKK